MSQFVWSRIAKDKVQCPKQLEERLAFLAGDDRGQLSRLLGVLEQKQQEKGFITISDLRNLEPVERKFTTDIATGVMQAKPAQEIRFSEFAPQYLEYAKHNKASKTYQNEVVKFNRYFLPFFGRMRLSDINIRIVERYKAERQKDGVTNRTVNIELNMLSVMFKLAIRWAMATNNPLSQVERMKEPQRRPRYLTTEEVERFLASAKKTYLYPLVLCALHTGMRQSELFNLRWEDVDFEGNTIAVQPKEDWNTKSYRPRVLEMTDKLRLTLSELYQDGKQPQEYVFTYAGQRIVSNVKRTFKRIVQESGVQGVTLHVLRHTFASYLAMQGVPLMHIQQLLGHQDYRTTLIYAHVSTESHKSQVHKLPF